MTAVEVFFGFNYSGDGDASAVKAVAAVYL